MDTSTLNADYIRKHWKPYTVAPTYRVDRNMGSGCAGDPPGFPSYFIRHVYTEHGNTPHNGPYHGVIELGGTFYRIPEPKDNETDWHADLVKAWNPLPIDSERVRLWMADKYRHHSNCYHAPGSELRDWSASMIIFPVPYYKLMSVHEPYEAKNWSENLKAVWLKEETARVEAMNERINAEAAAVCIPGNHDAVTLIRRYYPGHIPSLEMINNPPQGIEQWWETEASRPTEEACASTQRWHKQHPFSGTTCQWCGRGYEGKEPCTLSKEVGAL